MNFRHAAALALFLCGLPATLSAQTTATFISQDGMFRFNVGALVRCTEQPQRGLWYPQKSCSAGIPICDDPSTRGSKTLVCFAYPFAVEDFYTYVVAAFSVSELTETATEKECLSGRSDDLTYYGPSSGEPVKINQARFRLFRSGGGFSGQAFESHQYYTFHKGKCYELGIRSTWRNLQADDAPAGKPRKNWNDLELPLDRALNSFRFLK